MTKRSLLLGGLAFVALLALVHELAKTTPAASTAGSLAPVAAPPLPPLTIDDYR